MSNSLMEKMLKSGSVKHTHILSDSPLFKIKDSIPTEVPIINIALSGRPDGGLSSGLTFLAGESKNFKSLLGLMFVKAYMRKYPDSVCLYYDTEFGTTPPYVKSTGIDTDRVLHIPIEHLEQLKFDITQRLKHIERGDKYIIFIDSVGNLASKKEVEDAEEGKSTTDMTRARVMKSLWRIVTPSLTTKDIPCVAINHTYKTMELYSRDVMSGGCLVEGTEIMMFDGQTKEVQDILPGDIVKTLVGNKPVTHSWNPETLENGTPGCFEITFEDGYSVTVSDEHPFLTDKGWVKAKDLSGKENIVSLA